MHRTLLNRTNPGIDLRTQKWRTATIPMKSNSMQASEDLSRRDFLKNSGAALVGTALGGSSLRSFAEEAGSLRIGLVGCGGRGTGAAAQALGADENVKL